MTVYVYEDIEDIDNNVVEVFETLKAAKECAYLHWGKELVEECGWETGNSKWGTCEYVTIYKRKIKEKP